MSRRWNSHALAAGGRVQKLSVNAELGCPHRAVRPTDPANPGTATDPQSHVATAGGCTFCLNEAFTPSYCMGGHDVAWQLREGIEFHRRRYRRAERYVAYFQSFSNTNAPVERLRELYESALGVEGVMGIIVGTRPDCIDSDKLDLLAELARDHYVAVEYGVESCNDEVLRAVNRGHDFACARQAIIDTALRGVPVGAHFILGLPRQSDLELIDQTLTINELPLTSVKFHQLQIFRGTAMEADWRAHPERYRFWTVAEYVDFFIEILRRLRPDVVVERFAGECPPRYHAREGWGFIRNEQLVAMLDRRMEELNARQGDMLL